MLSSAFMLEFMFITDLQLMFCFLFRTRKKQTQFDPNLNHTVVTMVLKMSLSISRVLQNCDGLG